MFFVCRAVSDRACSEVPWLLMAHFVVASYPATKINDESFYLSTKACAGVALRFANRSRLVSPVGAEFIPRAEVKSKVQIVCFQPIQKIFRWSPLADKSDQPQRHRVKFRLVDSTTGVVNEIELRTPEVNRLLTLSEQDFLYPAIIRFLNKLFLPVLPVQVVGHFDDDVIGF